MAHGERSTQRQLVWCILFCVLTAVWLFSVSGTAAQAAADDGPREIPVRLLNFSFEPGSIQVTAGETVHFIASNASNMVHTFTITWSETDTTSPLVDVSLDPGEEQVIPFTVPTDVTSLYLHCVPHDDRMVGSLTVVAADGGPGGGDDEPSEPGDGVEPEPTSLLPWLAGVLVLAAAAAVVWRRTSGGG